MLIWEDVDVDFFSSQYYLHSQKLKIHATVDNHVFQLLLLRDDPQDVLIIRYHQIKKLVLSKTMTSWRLQLRVSIYGSETVDFDIISNETARVPQFVKKIIYIYYKHDCKNDSQQSLLSFGHPPVIQRYDPIRDLNNYSLKRSFPTQELAYQYKFSLNQEVQKYCKLYSYEDSRTGKRQFMIDSIHTFPSTYLCLKAEDRHFYEIIEEKLPCHMYMDIEYIYEKNKGHQDPLALILYTFSHYLALFVSLYISPSFVFVVTSPHEKKYSRHLIFHLPNDSIFENNQRLNLFVKSYILTYFSLYLSDPHGAILYRDLFAMDKNDLLSSVIDPAVYTKNRAMRLVLSQKYSSNKATSKDSSSHLLRITGRMADIPPYILLQQSYITVSGPTNHFNFTSSIGCSCFSNSVLNTKALLRHHNALVSALPSRTTSDQPQADPSISLPSQSLLNALSESAPLSSYTTVLYEGLCPCDSLEDYFKEILLKRGRNGFIRKCRIFTSAKDKNFHAEDHVSSIHTTTGSEVCYVLDLEIGEDRWCQNIQRAHKSNHIYFQIHLFARLMNDSILPGSVKGVWCQKCHDYQCSGYSSPYQQIPEKVSKKIVEYVRLL